jgi:TonB family protein
VRWRGHVPASIITLVLSHQLAVADAPMCAPNPKPVNVDVSPPDGESIVPHQGDLLVEVTIGMTGDIISAKIVSSSDNWFDQGVLLATRDWRFTPPKQICRLQFSLHFWLRHDQ